MDNQTQTNKTAFKYAEAFRRNRGLISVEEQHYLRDLRVVIAGLGGTGGAQAQALARVGIGHFTVADLDQFELSNFNRQAGASIHTLGRKKTEVIKEMILSINPEATVKTIEQGITTETIDSFLQGAHLVIDSLDFYCFKERMLLYASARERGLWVINCAPLGFGCTLLTFDPKGMKFEDFFDFQSEMSEEEKIQTMMFGISPSPLVLKYIDRRSLRTKTKGNFPCVSPAFSLVGGVVATEALKLLLAKTKPQPVPTVFQFDALLHVYKKKRYAFGMSSPWQRMKRKLAFAILKQQQEAGLKPEDLKTVLEEETTLDKPSPGIEAAWDYYKWLKKRKSRFTWRGRIFYWLDRKFRIER